MDDGQGATLAGPATSHNDGKGPEKLDTNIGYLKNWQAKRGEMRQHSHFPYNLSLLSLIRKSGAPAHFARL